MVTPCALATFEIVSFTSLGNVSSILLTDILESPIVYINTVRCSLFEAVDLPEKVAQENYASVDFTISPNKNDSFLGLVDYNEFDYEPLDYQV